MKIFIHDWSVKVTFGVVCGIFQKLGIKGNNKVKKSKKFFKIFFFKIKFL